MKTRTIITKLAAIVTARRKHKLRAATRALPQSGIDADETEPTTRLSSAFIVVLVLHVVAVGGIYAFNSIKASRRAHEPQPAPLAVPAKPAASAPARKPAPASATHTAEKSAPASATPGVTSPRPAAGKQHQVKAGETATKIAGLHGLKTDELLAANNLKPTDLLHPGQTLIIPAAKTATTPKTAPPKAVNVPPTKTTPGVHIVKRGDTATSIAKMYGLTPDNLLKLNKISDAKKLQEGQPLTIPKKKG